MAKTFLNNKGNELLDLIASGESETLEFKRSTGSLREGIETICAFANHRGGYVLFGIDDRGDIIGQQVTDDTIKNIANAVKQNLIENFHAALTFVLESIGKNSLKRDVHRTETWEFPVSVLREALVNMIVHRDYRQNIKSTVEIRPSAVSFYNPAQLFGPSITIERLKTLHPSRPGNRLIAKIFYLMGLFENWGGGTLKILSETIKSGKPSPEFYFEHGMFRLVLLR